MAKSWIRSEIETVKKFYAEKGAKWLSAKVNHPLSAIYQKAQELNLKFSPDYENRTHKICPKCKLEKPISHFSPDKSAKSGRKSWCRECSKLDASIRNKTEGTKKSRYIWKIKKFYGVTLEKYDKMFQEQNGLCAICGQSETVKNQYGVIRLAIDHNHKSGKVRGLLCQKCNYAMGALKIDDFGIELLLKAIEYVRRNL